MTRKSSGIFSMCYNAVFAPFIWILNLGSALRSWGACGECAYIYEFMSAQWQA